MTARTLAPVLAALAVLLGPLAGRVPASEVRDKVAGFAKEIARLLGDERQTEVAIGEFTGPPTPVTSAGPAIQVALIEELTALKVGVNEKAFVFVKGEYFVLEEERKAKEDLTVRLVATVRNKGGKKIDELSTDIGYRGNLDLVKLLAMNADLSKQTKADREKLNRELKKQLEKPPLHLAGDVVKVSEASPYGVEVLTQPAGGGKLEALRPVGQGGQAFAEIGKGQEYVLRLHNGSKHEAAVCVTIDGVDAFQFYEAPGPRPGTFLVAAGQTREIKGWPRDQNRVNAFLVGSFADSAAAKALKGSARVGTITAVFQPSWEGPTPPEYEGSRSVEPNATGLGREIKEASRVVQRTFGPVLAVVSIRYNK